MITPGDVDDNFRGIPSFKHMDLFGEFGLPKLPGVTSINVIEDGTADSFVNVYIDFPAMMFVINNLFII